MSPKEKAEELIHKFYEIESDSQYFGVNWKIAKQCALIAVNLAIEHSDFHCEFLYQVKNEIELL